MTLCSLGTLPTKLPGHLSYQGQMLEEAPYDNREQEERKREELPWVGLKPATLCLLDSAFDLLS